MHQSIPEFEVVEIVDAQNPSLSENTMAVKFEISRDKPGKVRFRSKASDSEIKRRQSGGLL